MKIVSAFSSVGIGETLIHEQYPEAEWTAVEHERKIAEEYQRRFPAAEVIIGDAYEYVYQHANESDYCLCSPECQTHSKRTGVRKRDPVTPDYRLFDLIVFLRDEFHGKWWVENVNVPELRERTPRGVYLNVIERHLFWSNVRLVERERLPRRKFVYCGGYYKEQLQDTINWLGVQLSRRFRIRGNANPCQIYWEAYHPLTGLDCFRQFLYPVQTQLFPLMGKKT
jgi:hypothetical protein